MFTIQFTDRDLKRMFKLQAEFDAKNNVVATPTQLIVALSVTSNKFLASVGYWNLWGDLDLKIESEEDLKKDIVTVLRIYMSMINQTSKGMEIVYLDTFREMLNNEQYSDAESKHFVQFISCERTLSASAMVQLIKILENSTTGLKAKELVDLYTESFEEE